MAMVSVDDSSLQQVYSQPRWVDSSGLRVGSCLLLFDIQKMNWWTVTRILSSSSDRDNSAFTVCYLSYSTASWHYKLCQWACNRDI